MSQYNAPLAEMQFVLRELAGLDQVAALPGFEDATADTVAAILEEAARFAADVLDPLNRVGDREGVRLDPDGNVATPAGFRDAYRQFCALGWNGLARDPEFGGQGMPQLVAAAVDEMWNAANIAFELCPMLTAGAIEAIERNGSDALKRAYLPKMVSGEWTGTMNLTEPQAGSDLAALRARAIPQGDGSYKLHGSKIFITYGEHDYTDNIVHLVLARTPDAPAGTRGISLFLVPKFLVNDDGTLGARNDVRCVSLEHKLGIHASPTAVLAFGDRGGAIAYLVGEENRGLEYMFVMMNLARFGVGMQGVGIADRAYQRACAYARERVQGQPAGVARGATSTPPIIGHPDVRRMLMTMRACSEAGRALGYVTAAALDHAHRHPDADVRRRKLAFAELMIPIVKGWSTEVAQEIAYLGVQVHGGMGYIEETGAAQYARDARITTIYEGTTGIQASDLIGRKIVRDEGAALAAAIADMRAVVRSLEQDDATLAAIGRRLATGIDALADAGRFVVEHYRHEPRAVLAGAVPFLELAGVVCGGAQLARSAAIAARKLRDGEGDSAFMQAKIATARHFADHVLANAPGLRETVVAGSAGALALADEAF